MGFNEEYATPIILDIETAPLANAAEFLDTVSAPSNYRDQEKIAAFITEKKATQLERAGLDLDLCRIVCVGVLDPTTDDTEVRRCRDEDEEALVLEWFWTRIATHGEYPGIRRLIGFNHLSFDLPVLLRRSIYRRIPRPVVNLDKYRSPHTDLMRVLDFNGALPSRSLNFYTKRFGIDITGEDPACAAVTGADIANLVADGTEYSWQLIVGHCLCDLRRTAALARLIGTLPMQASTRASQQRAS